MTPLQARGLLGVPASSSRAGIERAYRRLARHHHPDVGGDATTFGTLVTARAVLLSSANGRAPTPAIAVRRRARRARKVIATLLRITGRSSRRVI